MRTISEKEIREKYGEKILNDFYKWMHGQTAIGVDTFYRDDFLKYKNMRRI